MKNTLSDHELLSRIRQSDALAFNQLYTQNWKNLYIYALKKTGEQDDACDLVQDTFIECWDARHQIPELTVPLRFYLHGILTHKIARYFRDQSFKEKHEENFGLFLKQEFESIKTGVNLDQHPYDIERAIDEIQNGVAAMPKRMREIFELNKFEHLSIAEIAENLHLSPQTVKNQLNIALSRLKREIKIERLSPEQFLLLLWLIKS